MDLWCGPVHANGTGFSMEQGKALRMYKSIVMSIVVTYVAVTMTSTVSAYPPDFTAPSGVNTTAVLPASQVVDAGLQLQAADFSNLNVNLQSNLSGADLGSGANDVWGYVSPSGREYAIVGLHDGTAFVEVTDPTQPCLLTVILDAGSTWSDMAVYQQYAYNVNESANGLQVIDMTQIDIGLVTLVQEYTDNGIRRAHNVFVNPDSAHAYLCGANAPSNGLVAIDLSDPANPVIDGVWTDRYVHDVYVTNYADCPYSGRSGPCEIAFAFCGGSGMWVVDATDKANMVTIGTMTYPQIGYCHQGWASEDKTKIFFDDELDELSHGFGTRLHAADVSDLANPQYITFYSNGNTSSDHNLMVRGNYVFSANYSSGLRVVDVSDVNNMQEVGFFDTFPGHDNPGFSGAWGVYSDLPSGNVLISDQGTGLFVLDVSAAVDCQLDSHCNDNNLCTTDSCSSGVCVYGNVALGTFCDDGNICTLDGECDGAGNCVSTEINALACTDDATCNPGLCNTNTGFCECLPCEPAVPPLTLALDTYTAKNRYLTLDPANPGQQTALSITILDLPAPYQDKIGTTMWLGAPQEICENSGQTFPPVEGCGPAPGLANKSFMAAPLACSPVFRDWTVDGAISAYGDAIIPGGVYDVKAVNLGCFNADVSACTKSFRAETAEWGDIVSNCLDCPCAPADGLNAITDVLALLKKFQNSFCAPNKSRADIEPGSIDFRVTISDVLQSLGGFAGNPFPLDVSIGCP
jgi:choice-of-anchor B domain-containing protein